MIGPGWAWILGPGIVLQYSSSMHDLEADAIASCVQLWFENHEKEMKALQPENTWTVLCGIVLEDKTRQHEQYQVISIGIGTQCIGMNNQQSNTQGLVLHDSHAEVLARRSCLRYFYAQLLLASSSAPSIFVPLTASPGRYEFNSLRYALHFYTSQAPCGDACLYPTQNTTTFESRSNDEHFRHQPNNITGAKPVAKDRHENRFDAQPTGLLRTKSGRSDIPVTHQTQSMSCSDKLALWSLTGIQGALLSHWIVSPIYLTSIICSSDPGECHDLLFQALERACRSRVKDSVECLEKNRMMPTSRLSIKLSHVRFQKRKQRRDARSCRVAWNWARMPQDTTSFETLGHANFFLERRVEATLGSFGQKVGSNVKKPPQASMRSRLSKSSFYAAFQILASVNHPALERDELSRATYHELKTSARAYQDLRRRVFYTPFFRLWLHHDAQLDRFTCPDG